MDVGWWKCNKARFYKMLTYKHTSFEDCLFKICVQLILKQTHQSKSSLKLHVWWWLQND